jgi:hypothetical protein
MDFDVLTQALIFTRAPFELYSLSSGGTLRKICRRKERSESLTEEDGERFS